MILEELEGGLHKLRGIGPSSLKALDAMGIHTLQDLLWHIPKDYEDRKTLVPFSAAAQGKGAWVNTRAQVLNHERLGQGVKATLKITVQDSSERASLLCFGRDFLARQLPIGSWIRICGPAQYRFREVQLSAFDFESSPEEDSPSHFFDRILPRYALSGDLNQGFFRKVIRELLESRIKNLDEILPQSLLDTYGFLRRSLALEAIHNPQSLEEADLARKRLVYEELFIFQLKQLLRIQERKGSYSLSHRFTLQALPEFSPLIKKVLALLPFNLTEGQTRSLKEILRDLEAPWPMSRLLQGDVGCGKTLVALLACIKLIEEGHQAALLVPTVLLARQHALNADKLLSPLGIQVALMAGPLSAKGKEGLINAVGEGAVQLIIGTHGLFSQNIEYADLQLVVVDEQHRFGVAQRNAMLRKAKVPNLLMMSATPIPQTLALSVFGDMESSVIRQLPAQRKPLETHLARMGNEQKVYDWVRKELEKKHQAYFVYPLIEGESSVQDLKDAQTMYQELSQNIYPDYRVRMIHSKIDESEKEEIMAEFAKGSIDLLVATSVVEVGIDVANATCIVIEHAERFGLAALHQLRGRVGRGSAQAYCFLVYKEPLSEEGKHRVMVMKQSSDGFKIAEEDLKLRGPGDLRGLRQSGFMKLRIADLARDLAIMEQSRKDAMVVLDSDPQLEREENQALKRLLDHLEKQDRKLAPLAEEEI